MARLPRICLPGIPQHIIQRGVNRHACFASEEDFAAYIHWLEEYSRKYQVAIQDIWGQCELPRLSKTPS
jgi:putative transposase